jgi:hypothetical protein
MIERVKWVDRKFNFDYPVGMFPMILARLRGTPVRLEDIVGQLPQDFLSQPIDGGWSVKETIGHFISVESLHIGRLDDYDANLAQLRPADMSNTRTYEANYSGRDVHELLRSFRGIRSEFVQRMQNLDEAGVSRSAHHPRLNQPMRLTDMALFAAEHDDQHIAILLQMI